MEAIKKIYKIGSKMNVIQDGSGCDSKSEMLDTIERIVDVSLKLAYNGCYDNKKRLIFNDLPINGTNVAKLLANAIYNLKNNVKQKGKPEFIFILKKIGVDPDSIKNINIRRPFSNSADIIAETSIRGPTVFTNTEEIRERKSANFNAVPATDLDTIEDSTKKLKKQKSTFRRSPYQLRKKNAVFWIIPT